VFAAVHMRLCLIHCGTPNTPCWGYVWSLQFQHTTVRHVDLWSRWQCAAAAPCQEGTAATAAGACHGDAPAPCGLPATQSGCLQVPPGRDEHTSAGQQPLGWVCWHICGVSWKRMCLSKVEVPGTVHTVFGCTSTRGLCGGGSVCGFCSKHRRFCRVHTAVGLSSQPCTACPREGTAVPCMLPWQQHGFEVCPSHREEAEVCCCCMQLQPVGSSP
jgi:hypothetical protein